FAKSLCPAFADFIHFDEPLFRGAEDDWIVAAPAMRVGVLVGVMRKERAVIREQLHDDGVRLEDVLAFVFGQTFGVNAAIVERSGGFETVLLARIEVVDTVTGSGVDNAAALIERDIGSKNAGNFERQKRVLEFGLLEMMAFELCENARFFYAGLRLQRGDA